MNSKRGQGLSTNAIILIILGVLVLAILILGFTLGWSTIVPFLSTNNIDNIKTSCSLACSTGSTYDFCSTVREVKDGVNDKFKASCFDLLTNEEYNTRNYGIEECPTLASKCVPAGSGTTSG